MSAVPFRNTYETAELSEPMRQELERILDKLDFSLDDVQELVFLNCTSVCWKITLKDGQIRWL